MSHNTEGLLPHLRDFSENEFLRETSTICLQETWLTPAHTLSNLLPDYEHICVCRQNQYIRSYVPDSLKPTGRGGGVLFIRRGIEFTEVITTDLTIECVAVQLQSPAILLVSVYGPPTLNIQHFSEQLNILLQQSQANQIIILGDFNVDCFTSQIPSLKDSFTQMISNPTTRKGTAVDQIYLRNVDFIASGVVPCNYSYHEMTYVIIKK